MCVAHHTPNPLGFNGAAHVLRHVIDNRLECLFETGLGSFNVWTVADKTLVHLAFLSARSLRLTTLIALLGPPSDNSQNIAVASVTTAFGFLQCNTRAKVIFVKVGNLD